jgi:hypothetical protein
MHQHLFDLGNSLLKLLTRNQLLYFGKIDLFLLNGISPKDFSLQRFAILRFWLKQRHLNKKTKAP